MCGIAGIVLTNEIKTAQLDEILSKFAESLKHRGPDGTNHVVLGQTGLVHTRLSIIDLEGGTQPLYSNSSALIANGEIYNYKELSAELTDVELKTQSDCELPLHLWLKNGISYAKELRGMYAIAIHDQAKQNLILSRDPFGIKPLYLSQLKQGIAFASEPQALLKAGLVKPKINKKAREELLQLQFTLGSKTIFEGIDRVLPGENLIFHQGKLLDSLHQDVLPAEEIQSLTEIQALKKLDTVLENSVAVHLRSDVPHGLFLSGGIDSSTILALTARLSEQPLLAFTASFDVKGSADERAKAQVMTKAVGAKHELIEINEKMVWQHLPEIVATMDDPCADYAIIPTWFLAREARKDLKVILCGEGGDELFGGYGRYRSFMRHWLLGQKAMRARGAFNRVEVLRETPLYWREPIAEAEKLMKKRYRSRLQQAQAIDCKDWLPHDLLLKLDRCLMTHGIEGRTPFLDPLVANFAFTLPDSFKIRQGFGKWLLRRWLQEHFPAADAFSPKQGFTVPVGAWISHHAKQLGELVAQQPGVLEIADPSKVKQLFQICTHKNGTGIAAWTLLFYALWHQHHLLGHSSQGDVFEALSEK